MKHLAVVCGLLACGLVWVFTGCRQTTSPSVPKGAIERAADTKIEDAGSDADVAK